jgi:hypothetical protein
VRRISFNEKFMVKILSQFYFVTGSKLAMIKPMRPFLLFGDNISPHCAHRLTLFGSDWGLRPFF